MKYLIVIEPTEAGFSAFSPDLDGCVAAGATVEEVERRVHEAIQFHIEGLRSEGLEVPQPKDSSCLRHGGGVATSALTDPAALSLFK